MNKIPYASTKVAPEQTKAEIEKLLKEHGIKDIQWTMFEGRTTLKFLHHVTVKGVERTIGFTFQPPIIPHMIRQYNSKTFCYEKVSINNEPVAYRLLFWYLKSKLEAVEYGLQSMEKEFMAHIMVSLPSGEESTFGEKLEQALEHSASISEFQALPYEPEKSACEQKKVIIDIPKTD